MSEKIHGLIVQKSTTPVPSVGEKRRFSVTQATGRTSGKPYNKIKREAEGYGKLYEVVAFEPTGRAPDMHGNVSFNIDLLGPIAEAAAPASSGQAVAPQQRDSLAEHLAKAGKLLKWSHDMAREVFGQEGYIAEDARTLFIAMQKDGYISEVPIGEGEASGEDEGVEI